MKLKGRLRYTTGQITTLNGREEDIKMNNNLEALNNYLFEQIERVNDVELSDDELEKQLKKSDMIVKISKAIIDNANTAIMAQKHFSEYGKDVTITNPLLGVTPE